MSQLSTTVALLALHEIQVRGESQWENRQLRKLTDHRVGRCLPTIIIGNPPPGQSADDPITTLGLSVLDRIHDGGCILYCNWASIRGRALSGDQ